MYGGRYETFGNIAAFIICIFLLFVSGCLGYAVRNPKQFISPLYQPLWMKEEEYNRIETEYTNVKNRIQTDPIILTTTQIDNITEQTYKVNKLTTIFTIIFSISIIIGIILMVWTLYSEMNPASALGNI